MFCCAEDGGIEHGEEAAEEACRVWLFYVWSSCSSTHLLPHPDTHIFMTILQPKLQVCHRSAHTQAAKLLILEQKGWREEETPTAAALHPP